MVQIKTGHESPVIVVLGPNCRPPNSSHFRNLKHLKIDMVVSQKKKKKREREGKNKKGGREGGREVGGRRQEPIQEMSANKNTLLRKKGQMHKLCSG